MRPSDRYTYANAGFNGFLARSMTSNPQAQTLADGIATPSRSINFDTQQSSGVIADNLTVGKRLELQGNNGRIVVKDEQENEVGWVGNLDT